MTVMIVLGITVAIYLVVWLFVRHRQRRENENFNDGWGS
jgi:phage shock protein PspC (stress-responsive transcriptional regulator)